MRSILGVALVGCSISNPSGVAGDDNAAIKDPPLARPARAQLAAPSGGTMPATATSTPIECTPSQWIQRHPDGSYREHSVGIALIPGIDPTGNYAIEQCDHIYGDGNSVPVEGLSDCPYPDTCTNVDPFPPYPVTYQHPVCTWSKGRFWDGKLFVECVNNWTDHAADGTVVANHSDVWQTTTLHTW